MSALKPVSLSIPAATAWLALSLLPAAAWAAQTGSKAPPAAPPAASAPAPNPASRYEACLDRAETNPADAYESALAWRDEGGGVPARHCLALAYARLGRYGEAAGLLEELSAMPYGLSDAKRAELLGQAGTSWIAAGETARAVETLGRAITMAPNTADLLIERARAHSVAGDIARAVVDLEAAVKLQPRNPDAFALLGAARLRQEDEPRATAALATALKLSPAHPGALLERAKLHLRHKDIKAARRDILALLNAAPDTAAAEEARLLLETLDVRPD